MGGGFPAARRTQKTKGRVLLIDRTYELDESQSRYILST
jgi:hypothetical protein